jgi:septal ring factor EnvC (AmiA/AmiB activator)
VAFDPTTLITGVFASGAVVAAAWLQRVGNRGRNQPDGVSLTKVIDDRVADFKQRIAELEAETRQLRSERDHFHGERDQMQHEIDYLNQRNVELGGP